MDSEALELEDGSGADADDEVDLDWDDLAANEFNADRVEYEDVENDGLDAEEFDAEEFDAEEFDAEECDAEEFDAEEFDAEEFDAEEFDAEEFDAEEFDAEEFDAEEFDAEEFDDDALRSDVWDDGPEDDDLNRDELESDAWDEDFAGDELGLDDVERDEMVLGDNEHARQEDDSFDSSASDRRAILERLKCTNPPADRGWTAAEKRFMRLVMRDAWSWAEKAISAARTLDVHLKKSRLRNRWRVVFADFFGGSHMTRGRVRRIRRRILKIAAILIRPLRLVKVPRKDGDCNGRCFRGSFRTGFGSAEAYTTSAGRRRIYLCPIFFSAGTQFAAMRNPAVAARTIVHEVVHEIGIIGHKAVPGSKRKVDTASDANLLARKKPFRTGLNPESFAWFFF